MDNKHATSFLMKLFNRKNNFQDFMAFGERELRREDKDSHAAFGTYARFLMSMFNHKVPDTTAVCPSCGGRPIQVFSDDPKTKLARELAEAGGDWCMNCEKPVKVITAKEYVEHMEANPPLGTDG